MLPKLDGVAPLVADPHDANSTTDSDMYPFSDVGDTWSTFSTGRIDKLRNTMTTDIYTQTLGDIEDIWLTLSIWLD